MVFYCHSVVHYVIIYWAGQGDGRWGPGVATKGQDFETHDKSIRHLAEPSFIHSLIHSFMNISFRSWARKLATRTLAVGEGQGEGDGEGEGEGTRDGHQHGKRSM